jgi:hypothetical protein
MDQDRVPGFLGRRHFHPYLLKQETKEPLAMDDEKSQQGADPELQRLRDSIDNIDAALIHILAERLKCTKLVGS